MKKPHWMLGLAAVFFTFAFTSCEEQSEVSEYANWKERNQLFIDSIAFVAQNNPNEWRIIKAYDLPDDDSDNLATKKDVNDYIYCHIEEVGEGSRSPIYTDSIRANYRVRLINDEIIDQSYRGDFNPAISVPAKFSMSGGMIKGWVTALQRMHIGDLWTVYMPYTLGYGTNGSNPIPGYSTLIYSINLAGIYPTGTTVPAWK